MGELLALYWRDGRKPLAKQMQRGLAKAFGLPPQCNAGWITGYRQSARSSVGIERQTSNLDAGSSNLSGRTTSKKPRDPVRATGLRRPSRG